jgi:hypothetical protein
MEFERDGRRLAPGRATADDHRISRADQRGTDVGKHTLVETIPDAAPGATIQRRGQDAAADPSAVHQAAARGVATPARPLPFADLIQRCFGRHDISAVQAHTGGEATESARAMGADAYATGSHVVLGDRADLHTVAHEAAHVIQQRGGVQLHGGVGAVGDPHERHADAVADAVVQGRSAEALLDRYAGADRRGAAAPSEATQRAASQPVQRMKVDGVKVTSALSSDTRKKHVGPASIDEQKALAEAQYLHTTFVTAETDITGIVDADGHDFPGSSKASDQFNLVTNVKTYLWQKLEPGKGKPVKLVVEGKDTECEIGVIKNGENAIRVVHFRSNHPF